MANFHKERRGIHACPPGTLNPDKTGHLYQNTITKAWCCFKCGAAGRGEPAAKAWLSTRFIDPEVPLEHVDTDWYDRLELSPSKSQSTVVRRAWDYLESHNVDPVSAVRFKLGTYNRRLIIPVIAPQSGQLVLYQERKLFGKKAFKTTGFRSQIYPMFHDDPVYPQLLIVVESLISAIRLSSFADTVALCGKQASTYQLERLKSETRNILIWLDGDAFAHGVELMSTLLHRKSGRIGIAAKDIDTPGRDPCDYKDSDVRLFLRENMKYLLRRQSAAYEV